MKYLYLIVKFIFSDFVIWLGTAVLLSILMSGIADIIRAFYGVR